MLPKRLLLYMAIILLGVVIFRVFIDTQIPPKDNRHDLKRIRLARGFREDQNALRLGPDAAAPYPLDIPLQDVAELDGFTAREVAQLRSQYVNVHKNLVDGPYQPWFNTFGQIIDKKPWWGIDGQFCYGYGGKESIEGASEESRFLLNPYLLLALLEGKAYISREDSCYPVYPRPTSLVLDAVNAQATAAYTMKRYFKEKAQHPLNSGGHNLFMLNDYNARDFGYNYLSCPIENAQGIAPVRSPGLLDSPVALRSLIHLGRSCRHPEGCNNASPYQPEMEFYIIEVPGHIKCKLWKNEPETVDQTADFTFVIRFE